MAASAAAAAHLNEDCPAPLQEKCPTPIEEEFSQDNGRTEIIDIY